MKRFLKKRTLIPTAVDIWRDKYQRLPTGLLETSIGAFQLLGAIVGIEAIKFLGSLKLSTLPYRRGKIDSLF